MAREGGIHVSTERFLSLDCETDLTGFLQRVSERIGSRLESVSALAGVEDAGCLQGGKMLRSRLAGRLMLSGCGGAEPELVERSAAAVEMVHTASLCHDDVIDSAVLRRSAPTLWQRTSSSGAVLVGDILLCEAMKLVIETQNHPLLTEFIDEVARVCLTEARQELVYRGKQVDIETCLELAEGKTGALFAFAASAAAKTGTEESAAFARAGLRVGTAYQLADDLMDVVGDEAEVGKTLGTDHQRQKFTLPQMKSGGLSIAVGHVRRLCSEAVEVVRPWPAAVSAIEDYLAGDLGPVLELVEQSLGNQAK